MNYPIFLEKTKNEFSLASLVISVEFFASPQGFDVLLQDDKLINMTAKIAFTTNFFIRSFFNTLNVHIFYINSSGFFFLFITLYSNNLFCMDEINSFSINSPQFQSLIDSHSFMYSNF